MNTRLQETSLLRLLNHASVRLIMAVMWTTVMSITLLQSSAAPVIGQPAPQEWRLDYEMFLTFAHFIAFGGFTVLWARVFALSLPDQRAALFALIAAVLFSAITESLQTLVPDRGASLWDLSINALAAWAAYSILRR